FLEMRTPLRGAAACTSLLLEARGLYITRGVGTAGYSGDPRVPCAAKGGTAIAPEVGINARAESGNIPPLHTHPMTCDAQELLCCETPRRRRLLWGYIRACTGSAPQT